MRTAENLKLMRNYIAENLQNTGEFIVIEPGYRFGNSFTLDDRANRHIYCEIRPELTLPHESNKFLIVLHADSDMSGSVFSGKIEEATRQGIYTANVFFRYINSDRTNQGPLFRRFILEEEKAKKGKVTETPKYHQRAARDRTSLDHYGKQRRENFRILKDIELYWANAASNGFPVYYQPESARLTEMLKVYRWGDVVFKREEDPDAFYIKASETSKTIKEPLLVQDLKFFTIQPLRQSVRPSSISASLESHITFKPSEKSKIRGYYIPEDVRHRLMLANFVALPEINVETEQELKVRHFLGVFANGIEFGIDPLMERQTTEIIKNLKNSVSRNTDLMMAMEDIRDLYRKLKNEGITISHGNLVTRMPSHSKQGVFYDVISTKEGNYKCQCPAFHFSKKDQKGCKHIDELIAIIEKSEY